MSTNANVRRPTDVAAAPDSIIVTLDDMGILENPPVVVGQQLRFQRPGSTTESLFVKCIDRIVGETIIVEMLPSNGSQVFVKMAPHHVILPLAWALKHPRFMFRTMYQRIWWWAWATFHQEEARQIADLEMQIRRVAARGAENRGEVENSGGTENRGGAENSGRMDNSGEAKNSKGAGNTGGASTA